MNWSRICKIDPTPLIAWLGESSASLPVRLGQRSHLLSTELVRQVAAVVLPHFEGPVRAHGAFLGHSVPGHFAPMHVDPQLDGWVTRVHVPIVTNPGCWMMWEDDGERIHFASGFAYTFNTLARHSVGNDGDTERVHLIFEVLKE